MELSLSKQQLTEYVARQLYHFFPDVHIQANDPSIQQIFEQAIFRTEHCFSHIALKSFHDQGKTYFSHLHSDQYTLFLWFLSNEAWKQQEDTQLASKLFYLNKTLNGVLAMYDAMLPDIFLIVHGGGVVLGKAHYNNYFVCYQGCTVGAIDGVYPVIGKGVAMAPQSSIIGGCLVGDYVTIGNRAMLRNTNLANHAVYILDSISGAQQLKSSNKPWAQSFFNVPIA